MLRKCVLLLAFAAAANAQAQTCVSYTVLPTSGICKGVTMSSKSCSLLDGATTGIAVSAPRPQGARDSPARRRATPSTLDVRWRVGMFRGAGGLTPGPGRRILVADGSSRRDCIYDG